jgi:hypothetical protein
MGTGQPVRFGGDRRPMRDIWTAVEGWHEGILDDQPVADVPSWAVVGYA